MDSALPNLLKWLESVKPRLAKDQQDRLEQIRLEILQVHQDAICGRLPSGFGAGKTLVLEEAAGVVLRIQEIFDSKEWEKVADDQQKQEYLALANETESAMMRLVSLTLDSKEGGRAMHLRLLNMRKAKEELEGFVRAPGKAH